MHRITLAAAFIAAALAGAANAADAIRGATLAENCAACHGPAGVSVSSDIPNLAAQKEDYVTTQLKAFRAGKRTNTLMNAIVSDITDEDIADLAAHFSSLPGAEPGAEGPALAGLDGTRPRFPSTYTFKYVKYHTIDFPDRKQVRHYWADPASADAAKNGKPLPTGSTILVEVFKAKLDTDGNPVTGADGHFTEASLSVYTAMQKITGAGAQVPDILSNGNWRYAVFDTNKRHKSGTNEAKCLACHKPESAKDFVFTLDELTAFAKAN
ncbi:MAG TPA: cytochrome P460 family protein [Thermohalobaculum sp.]|nr:cytochrome P460 family protein [Thermohalobaculum sp.]